jgi:hypothetical protein
MWILLGQISFIRINEYSMHEAANFDLCQLIQSKQFGKSIQYTVCFRAVETMLQVHKQANDHSMESQCGVLTSGFLSVMWILLGQISFTRINEYSMHEAAN